MKYIPGPWVICEDPAPNPYWTPGLTIGAGPGDLRRICDVTMLGAIGGGISPMQAATAALIASAPDLLSAAIETMQTMERSWGLDGRDDDYIYDEMGSDLSASYFALREAIAKASPP